MQGMVLGGILLSAFPIALGIALGVAGWRLYREQRAADERGDAP